MTAQAGIKPRFRGRSHKWAFFVSLIPGTALLVAAPRSEGRAIVAVYALSISGLFGVSALFHLCTWTPRKRKWIRRLDHSMIFVAIAGSYTAILGLAVSGTAATVVLWIVWIGAIAGLALNLAWIQAPKPLTAVIYVVVGWVALAMLPQILNSLGVVGFMLVLLGGAFYTTGAIVYATRWPDPVPPVFGYHEVFHAFVIAGAFTQMLAVAFFALPKAK